ncbi:MAG: hypothetical protein IT372_41110 [Polyangiaceae bacterium]|nr:hypothetical protein [Polyangiaceae bacterium]
MKIRLPHLALALALAGCPASPEQPAPDSPRAKTEQAASAAPVVPPAAPSGTPEAAEAPAAPATAPAAPAPSAGPATTAAAKDGEPAGGGRQAKPGWCAQDGDCPGGQVCEPDRDEKKCVPGCRSDATCAKGQKCRQVMCVRAPCPSMCQ